MTMMAKKDTKQAEQKPQVKSWNFPFEGVTVKAETREKAVAQLESQQKQSDKITKS